MDDQTRAVPAIAIIGASVRGTSILERVLASAPELSDGPLAIHLIDPFPPGSGRIWRAGQAEQLAMNTVAAQSTLFTDASLTCEGPVRPGPSLADWCRRVTADPDSAADLPPAVRAEASRTVDHSNPSRLLYGYYLRWCLERIAASAPASVDLHVHRARAVDLRRTGDGWMVHLDDGATLAAAAVVLAVGWLPRDDVVPHPRVVAPGNPIDQDLSDVAAGTAVGIRGLGMGFFDTVSQLTEQRGGRFVSDAGAVRYEASGAEPLIVGASRRGVPYRAKPDFGAPPFFPEQRILRAALAGLRARRPVDFTREVLPLIQRDALVDYYRALDRVSPGAVVDLEGLIRGLGDPRMDAETLVARHVSDPAQRLSLADAADPLARAAPARPDPDAPDVGAVVAEAVRRDADEAARGLDSPLKLALHSYAAARGAVIALVEFGGLTASSFAAYREYLAIAASFGSGPPLFRARQLLALHAAGIVRFAGPLDRVDVSDGHVTLRPRSGRPVPTAVLVEAWLPTPSVERTSDPLLRSLVTQGAARSWRFADGTPSDALDVRPSDGAVIGAAGEPVPGLFSVGVPHEDIRVFTIIAPVPGTDSSVLRETDAAARAALRTAAHAGGAGAQEANTEVFRAPGPERMTP